MSYFRSGIVAAAGDVTVSDPSGTIASSTVNAALTELSLRSPFVPGQFAVVCIDYDGRVLAGNDTTGAVGIGPDLTTALNKAKLTPFKTYERAAQVIPANGNGANLYVLGKGRTSSATYRNMANTADQTGAWKNSLVNYNRICTGSTGDFSDTTFDRIQAGFVTASGMNAGGYNPTGTPTTLVISCQLAGGGAANLPAETGAPNTSTITGLRIRFDPNTATVALRNVCGGIWKNTTSQITLMIPLGTAPSTSDVFYIETTELQFGSGTCHLADVSSGGFYSISGERYTAATTIAGSGTSSLALSACECTSTLSMLRLGNLTIGPNRFDPTGGSVGVGVAGRYSAASSSAINVSEVAALPSCSSVAIVAGAMNILRGVGYYSNLGAGSVFALGLNDAQGSGVGSNSIVSNQLPQRTIGAAAFGATANVLRICGNSSFGAGILLNSNGVGIRGVDISAQTGPIVQLGGPQTVAQSQALSVDDLRSTDGNNTGPVLKLGGQNSTVRWGFSIANTATAARDIDMSNGAAVCTFAGLATTNYFDDQGNNVVGSAGVIQDKPGKIITNRTATTAIGQIVRSNATSNEGTIAKADTAANAAGIIGVALNAVAAGAGLLIAPPGSFAAVQFDSAPTAGNIGYLSTTNAGNAQATAPTVSGTNQKNRLGIVQKVSGSFGYMTFNPDKLAITADGAA